MSQHTTATTPDKKDLVKFLRDFPKHINFDDEDNADEIFELQKKGLIQVTGRELWNKAAYYCVKSAKQDLEDEEPLFETMDESEISRLIIDNGLWESEIAFLVIALIEKLSLRLISSGEDLVFESFEDFVMEPDCALSQEDFVESMMDVHYECFNCYKEFSTDSTFKESEDTPYPKEASNFIELARATFRLVYFKFSLRSMIRDHQKPATYLDKLDNLLSVCREYTKGPGADCSQILFGKVPVEVPSDSQKRPRTLSHSEDDPPSKRIRSQ